MTIIDRSIRTDGDRTPPHFFAHRVRSARRYYLDLAPPAAADLVVLCGGREECASDYAIRRVEFPHLVLEWVVGGRGRIQLRDRWQQLRVGTLFAYGPGVPHVIEADPERPLVKHFVVFAGRDAAGLLAAAGVEPGVVAESPRKVDLLWLFETLLRDGSRGEVSDGRQCATLLRYLLGSLAGTSGGRAASGAREQFERCDAYLVEHAAELRSLTELADACKVSTAYLCRLYKRFGEQTPYQRLLRLRMSVVAELLASDERPVRAIAEELGWEDPFLMSRQFKSVFGVSPSGFRRLR